jgi:hypothetical protein
MNYETKERIIMGVLAIFLALGLVIVTNLILNWTDTISGNCSSLPTNQQEQ